MRIYAGIGDVLHEVDDLAEVRTNILIFLAVFRLLYRLSAYVASLQCLVV